MKPTINVITTFSDSFVGLGFHPKQERRIFAAMALQGMLGDPERSGSVDSFALEAVKHADALIEKLNEQQK